MQVQRIRQASCGIGDRNITFAHLARVVLEPDARRHRDGRSCGPSQRQVATDDMAVRGQLG